MQIFASLSQPLPADLSPHLLLDPTWGDVVSLTGVASTMACRHAKLRTGCEPLRKVSWLALRGAAGSALPTTPSSHACHTQYHEDIGRLRPLALGGNT